MATAPAPPPRPADDVIQDLQRSGWSRWSPRRAGVPALIDWWPAYVLVVALVILAALVTLRLALAAVIAWQLSGEGERLSNQLTELSEALKGNRSLAIGPYEIPPNIQERVRDLSDQGARIDEWSAAMAIGLITSLIDLVLVLVITFYLLLAARRLRAVVLRWLEPSHRPGARRVFSEIAH